MVPGRSSVQYRRDVSEDWDIAYGPYHTFLWRGTNQNRTSDVYEFDRALFGVNSSPFQAQFVPQQHAKKYKDNFPMTAETINQNVGHFGR